jgi:mRNA interferase MazF
VPRAPVVPQRGGVYVAPLGGAGEKLWVCVSNNVRNPKLEEFIAARLTTSRKPPLPSMVALSSADAPLVGTVNCDDLGPIYLDQVTRSAGALTPATMRRVNTALRYVLALQ